MIDVKNKLMKLIDEFPAHEGKTFEEALAEYLISEGVTVQRWIPVTERLPHEEDLSALGEVLVMRKGDVCTAVYSPSRSVFYRHGYRQEGVTHWMPMPEKLKEVE